MSFEVFSLGTSGMMPLPGRFLTSALVRREGELFLFDCGEGTQVSLKMLNLRWKQISSIFISHMHADHVTGLPGLLMLSSQVDRTEPLTIYGPARLADYIESSRKILDMYINYEIRCIPVEPGVIAECDEYHINCFPLKHTKQCFGYSIVEKERPGAFSVERALELRVPKGPLWGKLQRGEDVMNSDGVVIHPSDVLGEKRSGRKFSFVTDTMYFPEIADYVYGSDILFCEAMFSDDLEADAREKKHMTARQAAMCARDGEVGMLCLQHYSPRYSDRELKILGEEAKAIFPSTVLTRDRMSFDIPLKD
ncbi:MAG: ribonuclease Z [Bullifex sp.]|nr:ribonuclease Z [Spirochaetales bacterium]MDY3850215.1 ribonuclease Z [Bullifex sp.]MDD7536568.1 ribonuclease Z [Spirochaetales bacterium]MDY5056737.1 ribonuclease Z [Bullifex sp.]MDY5776761.1 ribonuclease Z [Bullifex sp.]